jgi:hypothetical protein
MICCSAEQISAMVVSSPGWLSRRLSFPGLSIVSLISASVIIVISVVGVKSRHGIKGPDESQPPSPEGGLRRSGGSSGPGDWA